MNSEELEEMFIESGEQNSHNQVSQFRHAVIENKKKHNNDINITYDTPVYFNIVEVINFIANMNNEMKDAASGVPQLRDGTGVDRREDRYFAKLAFAEPKQSKINRGPFGGEFDRFVRRLETKMDDERLRFILRPRKPDGSQYKTGDIECIIRELVGYSEGRLANITIVDLAGIPFEETSIVVSLTTRLIFELGFLLKRKPVSADDRDVPILIVYEEAHKYVPNVAHSRYNSVRTSIERIAKEGRKYGISLMIVSQRPSEISETIFSQCNNFVAMRLTNPADQNYVKRLLPDTVSNITENLPSLERQEAIIIGDAISIPSIVKIDSIAPEPRSNDVNVLREWQKDWAATDFVTIMDFMQRRMRL